jgi:hypothetical protein
MEAVASATPELSGMPARRFDAALARLDDARPFDEAYAETLLAEVLGEMA